MTRPKAPAPEAPASLEPVTAAPDDADLVEHAGEGDALADDAHDGGALLLELVEEAAARRRQQAPPPPPDGVVLGELVALDDAGRPLVRHGDGPTVPALSTVPLNPEQVGRLVALAFDKTGAPAAGDSALPIVLGVIHNPEALLSARAKGVEASHDGQRVELSADKEIVLRCGDASITLTRAGKILLKGRYVLTHSSGVNRIRGGSVQIN